MVPCTHGGRLDHESGGDSRVLRSINIHSGSACPQSDCLCCDGGGGDPDKQGALNVVFHWYFQLNNPTQWFLMPTQCLCMLWWGWVGWEGGLEINKGPSKLFSSSFWR